MDSTPSRKPGHVFELFLYTAIIAETGLAAFFYKLAFQDSGLGSLKIYFAVLYFAFLAWCIGQLNKLHRKRKELTAPPQSEPEVEITPEPIVPESVPAPVRQREQSRPLLGLTFAQLVIVVIVFGTAVATFSWAFWVWAGRG